MYPIAIDFIRVSTRTYVQGALAYRPERQRMSAYERFLALHHTPGAFIMPNPWDGMSALLLKNAGFAALGTSSIAIASAAGLRDARHAIGREAAIANGSLIASLTGLPVNGDLEDGFGPEPADCVATVDAAIAGGLAGLGIEDTNADPARPIHDFDVAVARIRAAAKAARGRIVLTARTDNFLYDRTDLDDTIRRLVAFAEAGADVLYAPGLPDMDAIRAVVRAVAPKPVNIVNGPRNGFVPLAELAAAGVRRVSVGGSLYRKAMSTVAEIASALHTGDLPCLEGGRPWSELTSLLPPSE
jgi:2-methylisocitrate lyase-like PEP mutase family enzyme